MGKYTKAITAALTALVGVLLQFGVSVDWATPELIAGVAGIASTILVYALPND